jgi:pyruvate,water dikinase
MRRSASIQHSPYCRDLRELRIEDAASVGGKAAWLGELLRAGCRVPNGFAITVDAFRAFLAANGLADADRPGSDLGEAIVRAPVPHEIEAEWLRRFRALGSERVAVRSSGAFEDGEHQSWAGQLESTLNVTAATLVDSVKRCWASAFSERAAAYRSRPGVHVDATQMAVVVQRMLHSEKSGVAFSVHPVTGESDLMVVEAVYGLGEAIVGGEVTPERHVLDKHDLISRERIPHRQHKMLVRQRQGGTVWRDLPASVRARPVLTRTELPRIASLARKLESAFARPVDIEWAISDGVVYLVQCRPITSVPPPAMTLADLTKFRWMFCHVRKRSPFFIYLLFGGQTRLRLDLGFDYRFAHAGTFLDEIVVDRDDEDQLTERIRGLLTSEPRTLLRAMQLGIRQHAIAQRQWATLARTRWSRRSRAALAKGLERYIASVLPFSAFIEWVAAMDADLSSALKERLARRLGPDVAEEAYAVAIDPVRSGVALVERAAILQIASDAKRGRRVARRLDRHAERFGWMKNVGMLGEWHARSHYEDELRTAIAGDPAGELAKLRSHEHRRKAALTALLRRCRGDRMLVTLIELTNLAVWFRSYRIEVFYQSYGPIRGLLSAIGRTLGVSTGELLYLFPDEILRCLQSDSTADAELVRARQSAYLYATDIGLRYVTAAGEQARRACPPIDRSYFAEQSDAVIRGQPAFAGRAQGRAVVVKQLSDLVYVEPGDILVACSTCVDYVPALRKAVALVTEEGGILCHAAVASRELRIPAVIGTGNATSLFNTGDRIEVDSVRGTVRRLTSG